MVQAPGTHTPLLSGRHAIPPSPLNNNQSENAAQTFEEVYKKRSIEWNKKLAHRIL
jgi:hypothetical protein